MEGPEVSVLSELFRKYFAVAGVTGNDSFTEQKPFQWRYLDVRGGSNLKIFLARFFHLGDADFVLFVSS
ncbi:MAG: hypothetical protein CM1200mP40_03590 [Gammaproteobacteria bacterium]|nr:MAG: hypothetical protein CM1200mP40_03590 [Gammaproteobacteria bacterium]